MKKLLIICEGHAEQNFCDQLLKDHFDNLGIEIEYPRIAHSGGGIVPWRYIKPEIELHHITDSSRFITTFFDYYGLAWSENDFPGWDAAHTLNEKPAILDEVEAIMLRDVNAAAQARFIPNIILHEFETLMLSSYPVFGQYYESSEFDGVALEAICAQPPETINNGPLSAPSKRLLNHINGYNKKGDGVELAKLIGLPVMRQKCLRFHNWITKLERI